MIGTADGPSARGPRRLLPEPLNRPTRPWFVRRLAAVLVATLVAGLAVVAGAGAPAQAAVISSGAGRMFYFLGHGDMCLGVPEPAFSNYAINATVTTWSCEGNHRQKWERISSGKIVAGNGVCLGMLNPSATDSPVTTRSCNNTSGMVWNISSHPQGGHYYETRNSNGVKLCLSARWNGYTFIPHATGCVNIWDQRFYLDWHTKFRYVALGDSFSAGNGAGNYVDTKCYNSWDNYANKLDDAFREAGRTVPFTWSFGPSCGGAQTGLGGLVYWAQTGGGYWTPQATKDGYTRSAQTGFLNQTLNLATGGYGSQFNGAETAVATITIGGNDLGFSGLLKDCVLDPYWPQDCTRGNTEQVLTNAMPTLRTRLKDIYLDMGRKAPNAQIRVPNYPLPVATSDPWNCRVGISDTEIGMLTRTQNRLNQTIQDAVNDARTVLGTRLRVVDIATSFRTHTACAADPWTTGNQGFDTNDWYHLNARGHMEMARLIRNTL
ncbi:GDSL-like Lipase/Acylhydrolase family protein [Micromonospora nigra]|uniref:GDSL-like Lipase/Acylhydrolase family protein n=1 Tax=Micromonospora nigra TaxID=145857 RepID=A0A1C6RE00_9ACTN|nr:GDSL-type esterase/lipase family protein [Micromonospora nigra]SCL15331.1 GDSL-like Lipase/Acylhydrolase family protein [Micromonospora nigra]